MSTCQTQVRLTELLVKAQIAAGDELAAERVLQNHRTFGEA